MVNARSKATRAPKATGRLTCTGTTAGSFGLLANVATTGGGGAYLPIRANSLQATLCDFGASAGTNNGPSDILYQTVSYNKANNATFNCGNGTCP